MAELITLPNIGKTLEQKLKNVGITSVEELRELGSKKAFLLLKHNYSNVCLVHLYCLQGAIDLVSYNHLSTELKGELKKFADGLKIS